MKRTIPPKLAVRGGKPVLKKPYPPTHNISGREVAAALRVLRRGPLSGFIGVAGESFLGGARVRSLERAFCKKFKVKHAVSFNSATTALHGAIVALKIGPGDEVIVPPYTMSATAMAVIMNGAVPIFADVDENTFCLDPISIRSRITKRTKAIIVVNLFGQAGDFDKLIKVAKDHQLSIIEDNAQSPGAIWRDRYAGTIGDIGVFSLNIHKAIQSGEGGVLVTNCDSYALRAQLSRNHAESVVDGLPGYIDGPIVGSNYRLAEVAAAVAEVQLSRLDVLTKRRINLASYLTNKLASIPGLKTPHIAPERTHVFYVYPIKIDEARLGISRDSLVEAMTAEGFPMSRGYVKPLYLLPVFQSQKAFNDTHFPFKSNYYNGTPDYSKGTCPIVERLYEKEVTLTSVCQYPHTTRHIDSFVTALKKVLANKHELA